MKLILCKVCQDVVKLIREEERFCKCGKCSGQYTDSLNAWYKGGDYVIPIGFNNNTLVKAVNNQPLIGYGYDFGAFVIPKDCITFKKIN